ncbi:MAG: hypothetical protein C4526_00285 [Nitrospiraceae bacterium]|nr:MAG: hypothetical protein C4526_00285 [Nitrospiraceae bacterium]
MTGGRKKTGIILSVIGYLLSPLSWWNDLYLNIPLAYAGAWLVSLFYKPAFLAAFIACYWITNIAGFVLMHKGIEKIVKKEAIKKSYSKRDILKDIVLSLAYTGLIVILVKLNVIRPVEEYFK